MAGEVEARSTDRALTSRNVVSPAAEALTTEGDGTPMPGEVGGEKRRVRQLPEKEGLCGKAITRQGDRAAPSEDLGIEKRKVRQLSGMGWLCRQKSFQSGVMERLLLEVSAQGSRPRGNFPRRSGSAGRNPDLGR